jgi:hypothetical protein
MRLCWVRERGRPGFPRHGAAAQTASASWRSAVDRQAQPCTGCVSRGLGWTSDGALVRGALARAAVTRPVARRARTSSVALVAWPGAPARRRPRPAAARPCTLGSRPVTAASPGCSGPRPALGAAPIQGKGIRRISPLALGTPIPSPPSLPRPRPPYPGAGAAPDPPRPAPARLCGCHKAHGLPAGAFRRRSGVAAHGVISTRSRHDPDTGQY